MCTNLGQIKTSPGGTSRCMDDVEEIVTFCETSKKVCYLSMVSGLYQNKHVDIKLSAYDAFLELPSQVHSKKKDWKAKYFKVLGAIKPKGHKHDSQDQLRSHMPEGGEPQFRNIFLEQNESVTHEQDVESSNLLIVECISSNHIFIDILRYL